MSTNISSLSPAVVWEQFDAITRVPRPSKHEELIIAWLIDFAKSHNLEYRRDKIGNVVILAPATAGFENRPIVILQSHVDMVCEKNSDVEFDFMHDAIRTRIDGEWVKAQGTTLGADCGIGMAAALAMLIDPTVEHGPIEALFTVDEETGLTGAFELEDGMLEGKHLINLDSEDEGELFIGCAGGVDTLATFTYSKESMPSDCAIYRVDVSDLQGGHSGDDINKGLANSNKILSRLLFEGASRFGLRISYLDGGNLRNAIPREAYAVFGICASLSDSFEQMFKLFAEQIAEEFKVCEPNLKITLSAVTGAESVIDIATQKSLIGALVGLPNGVLAMSAAVTGLVETSTNLASVKFEGDDKIVVTTSQRSSVESAKRYAMLMIESVFVLAGATVEHSDGYPGWAPNPDSELLRVAAASYKELFGVEAKVKAIHAGLECGLFLERYPELDMISFGPTLRGVHSPDERLEIATVDKFWRLLCDIVKRIK